MMLECFNNLIGIDGLCDTQTPKSGKFINQLPGMKLRNISAAMTEENSSVKTFIESNINLAAQDVEQMFRVFLNPKMQYHSVIENETVGIYDKNLELISAEAGKYKGIRARLNKCKYFGLYVSSISLKIDAVLTTNILVFNLQTGTQVDSFPITTVADVPTVIYPNKYYTTNGQHLDLIFVIDSGIAGQYDGNIFGKVGCSACGSKVYANQWTQWNGVSIAQSADKISDNATTISHTGGLSINYSLDCQVEPVICNMAGILADPIRFRAAELILQHSQAPTHRVNDILTIHADDIDDLREEYGKRFAQTMDAILDNIRLPDDICFRCYQGIRSNVQIP